MLNSPPETPDPATSADAPPSRRELAFYASGVASTGLANGVLAALTLPIFNMVLGLNPAWIGMVGAATSIIAAFVDPVMGHIGDGTRSRWGRRRPYIVVGGAIVAVTVGVIFFVGSDWSPAGVSFNMRLCFSIIPAAGCFLALLAVRHWPLTRARCEEIQALLARKREAAMVGEA
jgi:Na+/melibiose symporter-like transporter